MNTSDTPLVSVIMPVYNGERYVVEAVESLLRQTYNALEILLVNDGSTDQTPKLLQKLVATDSRITIITNTKPSGHAGEAAFNQAARLAKGAYIAKLDADDIAMPDRIGMQVRFLQENASIFLVGSNLELIDEEGKCTGTRTYPTSSEAIFNEFYYRSCIANPSIMYRNGLLTDNLYLLKNEVFTDDYLSFFVHMNNGYKFANIPQSLTRYRIHKSNTVFTDVRKKWAMNMAIKQSFVQDFGYKAPLRHQLILQLITFGINTLPERFLIRIMNQTRKILNA